MGIQVVCDDSSLSNVSYFRLDFLIRTGRVVKFRRSNGEWVDVLHDRIRGDGGGMYDGPERRRQSTVRRVI